VLDLNARTGMLTFEAARIAANGAVWALAHDNKSFKTVKAIAERFDLLSRPQIVLSSMDSFEKDLKTVAGENVRFDAIIGRNIISRCSEKKELFLRITKILNKGGRIVLAEPVSSEGQRLSDLIDQSKIDADLFKYLTEAQTELFSDCSDSMVNWNSDSLKSEFNNIDKIEVSYHRQIENIQKRISEADIDFWFRTTDISKRRSLGSRIAQYCSEKQFQKLKDEIILQLSNKIVNWKTVYLYITAVKK